VVKPKPTGYNMLGFAPWHLSLAKRLIFVGWVERSETQYIERALPNLQKTKVFVQSIKYKFTICKTL